MEDFFYYIWDYNQHIKMYIKYWNVNIQTWPNRQGNEDETQRNNQIRKLNNWVSCE